MVDRVAAGVDRRHFMEALWRTSLWAGDVESAARLLAAYAAQQRRGYCRRCISRRRSERRDCHFEFYAWHVGARFYRCRTRRMVGRGGSLYASGGAAFLRAWL